MDILLQLLAKNSNCSSEDLAKELAISEPEVKERIAALEKSGAILGYHAVIDPEKTGERSVTALIEVKITPERGGGFDRFANRIAQFEQVESCYLMSGGYDLLVVVRGKDLREVALFVAEKLSSIQGVLSTATHFRLKAYKESGILTHRETKSERLPVTP